MLPEIRFMLSKVCKKLFFKSKILHYREFGSLSLLRVHLARGLLTLLKNEMRILMLSHLKYQQLQTFGYQRFLFGYFL